MSNEEILEAYQPEIWRLVQINSNITGASWYTIQFNNYHALNYKEVKEHQELLKEYAKYDVLELGSIGDSYGQWRRDVVPIAFAFKEAQAKTNTNEPNVEQ